MMTTVRPPPEEVQFWQKRLTALGTPFSSERMALSMKIEAAFVEAFRLRRTPARQAILLMQRQFPKEFLINMRIYHRKRQLLLVVEPDSFSSYSAAHWRAMDLRCALRFIEIIDLCAWEIHNPGRRSCYGLLFHHGTMAVLRAMESPMSDLTAAEIFSSQPT